MKQSLFEGCNACGHRCIGCHSGCKEYARDVIVGIMVKGEAETERRRQDIIVSVEKRRFARIHHVVETRKKRQKKGED